LASRTNQLPPQAAVPGSDKVLQGLTLKSEKIPFSSYSELVGQENENVKIHRHEIFYYWFFFHESESSSALIYVVKAFLNFYENTQGYSSPKVDHI